METLESVAVAVLEKELAEEKCPFKESEEGASDEEEEGIEEDDADEVQEEQANNGGTLGDNLSNRSPGKSGTVGGPCPADDYLIQAPQKKYVVSVPETDDVETGEYPVTLAAHHLIPGNAALGQSELYDFLGPKGSGNLKKLGSVRTREDVDSGEKKYEIKKHIGYNVNGCHNGAWLPGNYAIRQAKPKKKSRPAVPNTSPAPGAGLNWGALGDEYDDWKLNYVAAATEAADAQFHDTHEDYSRRVLKVLDKIAAALKSHLAGGKCTCCSKEKIPPPFTVKNRLYASSHFLRNAVSGGATTWSAPWFTSDHWSEIIFEPSRKTYERFLASRKLSRKVREE